MNARAAAALALLLTALPPLAPPVRAADDLAGSRWLAEDIGGGGVLDRAQSTLEILPGGRVAGSGGCNRYTGKGALARGKAAIGPLASTRMACPPALMNQETRFLAALARAARYEILPGGLMTILDARGAAVLRLSRM